MIARAKITLARQPYRCSYDVHNICMSWYLLEKLHQQQYPQARSDQNKCPPIFVTTGFYYAFVRELFLRNASQSGVLQQDGAAETMWL